MQIVIYMFDTSETYRDIWIAKFSKAVDAAVLIEYKNYNCEYSFFTNDNIFNGKHILCSK